MAVGNIVDSCGTCRACRAGQENYCEAFPTTTYGGVDRIDGTPTQGAYASEYVVRDEFVHHLPPELDPAGGWRFDGYDIDPAAGLFDSAARVWTANRAGTIDPDVYGVDKGLPVRGAWFVYNYVLQELAHRQKDELLLWDSFGAMTGDLAYADLALADEVAALLLAADGGDRAARAPPTRAARGLRVPHGRALQQPCLLLRGLPVGARGRRAAGTLRRGRRAGPGSRPRPGCSIRCVVRRRAAGPAARRSRTAW